jgi:hypothetical protein
MAQMIMVWAGIETLLDYLNALIFLKTKAAAGQLPKELGKKLRLLRRHVATIEKLAPVRQKAFELIAEADRLQTIRYDIIHGRISKSVTDLSRKITVKRTKVYTLEEVALTINGMLDLADGLSDLLDEIADVL